MTNNITISLCMIVKNEESVIERCITSIESVVDEIIVVDTGSDDCTRELAANISTKVKVFEFEWCDDFSKARNYSFTKATKEYIMWLDADDIIKEIELKKVKELKQNFDKDIDAVNMIYELGEDEEGNTLYSLRRNRIVKREKNFKWVGKIHEYLDVYGNILNSDICVSHKKEKHHNNRNLNIFENMIKNGEILSERDMFYYANELFYNKRYDEAIEEYNNFINMENAWVEDIQIALKNMSECYIYIGDESGEINSLIKSFKYGVPRSDFCCGIGYYFLKKNKFNEAIFWYELALNIKPRKETLNIINHSTYTWLPAIQLCVCYAKRGEYEKSNYYNELAAKYIPNNDMVIYNRNYLKDKLI